MARRQPRALHVWMGTVDRVDMLLPRQRAQVRHAAGGSDVSYEAHREQLEAVEATLDEPSAPEKPAAHPAENP